VPEAIISYYDAMGTVARTAPVNSIDATFWLMHGARNWLWVMAPPAVAYGQIHPNRSKAALGQLIVDWTGILSSDGYLVYQSALVLGSASSRRVCISPPAPLQPCRRLYTQTFRNGFQKIVERSPIQPVRRARSLQ